MDIHQDHFFINEAYAVVYEKRVWSTDSSDLLELLPKSNSACKVIHRQHLEDFYNDKSVQGLHVEYATSSDLEVARTQGFFPFCNHINNKKTKKTALQQFEELKSVENLEECLIVVEGSSHQLRDLTGQYIPVATYFTYIENHLSEDSHDLEKVVRLLKLRGDITVVDEEKFKQQNVYEALSKGVDIAAHAGKEIFSIPYYNAEEGRTESVQFLWTPIKEDFQKVMGTYEGKYKSIHRTAIEQDVFGLSCCEVGASLKFKV